MARADRLRATLLGTAVGDALGLPVEGMSGAAIARRWGRVDRYLLFGGVGIVSDDTEQAALVAQSLVRGRADPTATAAAFRRSLVGWLWRLPFGIGLATLRAGIRATLGLRRPGVRSAGNGAAMRAAVVGVALAHDEGARAAVGRALAEITHVDARAIDGALYVAEVAAHASRRDDRGADARRACVEAGIPTAPSLAPDLRRAVSLAGTDASVATAAAQLGSTGFVVHTLAFATFLFLQFGDDARGALIQAASAGGDTDTIGAIVGAWCGAVGAPLPEDLVDAIHDGPFGPTHLRALATDLAGSSPPTARYAWPVAMARNLALYPVVLAFAVWRLVPLRRALLSPR